MSSHIVAVHSFGCQDNFPITRSTLIMTYAMCGFANIGSLDILIGGLISIAPERSREITALGPRSILSGVLATLMTGAVVGILS